MARFFVPLDVNYQFDDKMTAVSLPAECLYVRSLAFAKRAATEGRIRPGHLAALGMKMTKPQRYAVELVEHGLWEATSDGWQIVGWLKHNPSNAQIDLDKENWRKKGQESAHKKYHVKPGAYEADCVFCNPPQTVGPPIGQPTPDPKVSGSNRTEHENEHEHEREHEHENEENPPTSQNGFNSRAHEIAVRAGEMHGTNSVNRGDGRDRFALAEHMTSKLMRTQRALLEECAERDDLDIDLLARRILDGGRLPPRQLPEPEPPEREQWEPTPVVNTGDYKRLLAEALDPHHHQRILKAIPPMEESA